jgi:hypothetical protein
MLFRCYGIALKDFQRLETTLRRSTKTAQIHTGGCYGVTGGILEARAAFVCIYLATGAN